jgi:hypothetical protein
LSRVTTLDGLTLKSFDPSVVRAHPAALEFFKSNFNDLKSARFPAKTVKAAAKVVKPVATTTTKKRTRSLEDLTAFAPVVMNAEQVMASEARMLEIFALQRLQDEQDEDED